MRLVILCLLAAIGIWGCNSSESTHTGGNAMTRENAAGPPNNDSLPGTWNITQAANATGQAYTGTVAFEWLAENVYAVKWETTAGKYVGVGIRQGNDIYIGWGQNYYHGISVYTHENGKLVGKWTAVNFRGKMGTENIILAGDTLAGAHPITGTPPGGTGQYDGKVTITESGSILTFEWITGGSLTGGVGLKVGNTVAVGWGIDASQGIMHYTLNGGTLQGKWVMYGMDATATENLAR